MTLTLSTLFTRLELGDWMCLLVPTQTAKTQFESRTKCEESKRRWNFLCCLLLLSLVSTRKRNDVGSRGRGLPASAAISSRG